MLAFSTSWNAHRHTDGEELVNELILLGFTAIEVCNEAGSSLHAGLMKAVESGRIRVTGVRGGASRGATGSSTDRCCLTSPDAEDRFRGIKLALKTIENAARFDSDYLVIDLGRSAVKERSRSLVEAVRDGRLNDRGFVQQKIEMIQEREAESPILLERIREAMDILVPYAEEKSVTLAFETRAIYEEIPTERELSGLLDEYQSNRVGYWHDFGHAQRKANLDFLDHAELIERFSDRLAGCYLNDCGWPDDDGQIPGAGDTDLEVLMTRVPAELPIVWKMSSRRKSDDIKSALKSWNNHRADTEN